MAEDMATATGTAAPAEEEEVVARDSDCDDDGDEVTPPGRIHPITRDSGVSSFKPHAAFRLVPLYHSPPLDPKPIMSLHPKMTQVG